MPQSTVVTTTTTTTTGTKQIAKTRRRNERKREKIEQQRQRTIEQLEAAGPSAKELESAALHALLDPLGFLIVDVGSDGQCLYRAIDKCLESMGLGHGMNGHIKLRHKAAQFMRAHPDDFMPFLDGAAGPMTHSEYNIYCDKVEKTSEWGGHVELSALSHVFRMPIFVYTADSNKPLIVGEEFLDNTHAEHDKDQFVIRVSYHRHECALGEHYNAVMLPNGKGGSATSRSQGALATDSTSTEDLDDGFQVARSSRSKR